MDAKHPAPPDHTLGHTGNAQLQLCWPHELRAQTWHREQVQCTCTWITVHTDLDTPAWVEAYPSLCTVDHGSTPDPADLTGMHKHKITWLISSWCPSAALKSAMWSLSPASSIPGLQPNPRCAAAGASKVTCGYKRWSDGAIALQLVHCLVDLPGTVHFRLSRWKKPGSRIQEQHFLDSLQVGDQHFSLRLCRSRRSWGWTFKKIADVQASARDRSSAATGRGPVRKMASTGLQRTAVCLFP